MKPQPILLVQYMNNSGKQKYSIYPLGKNFSIKNKRILKEQKLMLPLETPFILLENGHREHIGGVYLGEMNEKCMGERS